MRRTGARRCCPCKIMPAKYTKRPENPKANVSRTQRMRTRSLPVLERYEFQKTSDDRNRDRHIATRETGSGGASECFACPRARGSRRVCTPSPTITPNAASGQIHRLIVARKPRSGRRGKAARKGQCGERAEIEQRLHEQDEATGATTAGERARNRTRAQNRSRRETVRVHARPDRPDFRHATRMAIAKNASFAASRIATSAMGAELRSNCGAQALSCARRLARSRYRPAR